MKPGVSLTPKSTSAPAAIITVRVVGALLLRETRVRFGKSQLGYLWAILEPVAGIVALVIAFHFIGRKPDVGQSLALFFAIGFLGFGVTRKLSTQLGAAFDANQALLHFPVVQRVDTLIARAILEFATSILVISIIIGSVMIYEGLPPPAQPHIFGAGIALLALLGFGLGVINAVVNTYVGSWRQIEAVLGRALFLLSGVFFTPAHLPTAMVEVLSWNPIFHGIEIMRLGYYDGYRPDFISVEYLLGWGLITALIGLSAERFLPRGEV